MAKPDSPPGQGGSTPPPEPSISVVPVIAAEQLGATGQVVTGGLARIEVYAMPATGGPPIPMDVLEYVPDGPWATGPVEVAAGDYTVEAIASVSIGASAPATVPAVTTPPDPQPEPPTGALSATVSYGGVAYVFNMDQGEVLDDYRDPLGQFVQHCVLCTDQRLPGFRVFFRPDEDIARIEVVFELGDVHASNGTVPNMGAYSVQIMADGVALADHTGATVINAPAHWYWSRWRWQSELRPVRLDVAQAMADGLLPRLAVVPGISRTAAPNSYSYNAPMDRAGLVADQHQTGDRPEIGPMTEPQAAYLIGGAESMLSTLRAQLEAGGTFPWHFRDENTNAPLDWVQYPNASSYSADKGNPYIRKAQNTGLSTDTAHEPALAYVPYLLTGDPYALELLQFQCVHDVISQPPAARTGYCITFALRAHAWALRNLFQAAAITPADTPSWLLPQALFESYLAQELNEQMLPQFVNSPDPSKQMFQWMHLGSNNTEFPAGCFMSPWMDDFETMILGWMVRGGYDEWREVLEWKAKQTLAMTNGTSGWERARTTMYHLGLRMTQSDPFFADWLHAWEANLVMIPPKTPITDPNTPPPTSDITYHMYRHASLAQAKELNIAGAAECLSWLDAWIESNRVQYANAALKWTYQFAV